MRAPAERMGCCSDLIGRDLTRVRPSGRVLSPLTWAMLGGLLVAALVLAALRIDLLRVRYGLAQAVKQEKVLLEERRSLEAEREALRAPGRLADIAGEAGLTRPRQILRLERLGATRP